ncbi:sigma-70 family RNA polymerase sigma factor [Raineyella antarctica]|nr:sigma-70 family RNA polymerase sigma factor [Raineyella antarctica]
METTPNTRDLLTRDEERELARAVEAGVIAQHFLDTAGTCPLGSPEELAAVAVLGRQARERFLAANMGLVGYLVRRDAKGAPQDRDDLFQEGCLGLAEALETFDWARGTRFSTWAVPYVRSRIATARRVGHGGIRIPARRLRAAAAAGEQVLSVRSIHGIEELEATWWQDPAPEDDDGPGPADLAAAMRDLSVEERAVLAHRFGLAGQGALTRSDTARELALPVKRVRATEEAAIRHLREVCGAQR